MPKFVQPVSDKEAFKPKESISYLPTLYPHVPHPPILHGIQWGLRVRELIFFTLVIPRTVPEPHSSKQIIREVCGALPIY